jgi:hypothetical protein
MGALPPQPLYLIRGSAPKPSLGGISPQTPPPSFASLSSDPAYGRVVFHIILFYSNKLLSSLARVPVST